MNSYDRTKPFFAKLISRARLNATGSSKEIWHVALDLTGSGISYRPGDSFGICPENDPQLVDQILQTCGYTGDEEVVDTRSQHSFSIRTWLKQKANLAVCSKKFLQLLETKLLDPFLQELLAPDNDETYTKFLQNWNVPEVLNKYPKAVILPQELVQTLSPLLPRLYSIASSQSMHPNEVHLTVSYVTYEVEGRKRFGVCSHFLCDLASEEEAQVAVYLQSTKDFMLPEDDSVPVVMIGPGTGVAPFRAFMQERISRKGPTGHNWLFFGEREQAHDFLYQDFWVELVNRGSLRLETAFSRDQAHKVYVQDKLWENRSELWKIVEKGAKIYVCGDASRMAKDVDACLLNIISEQANLSSEGARAFLTTLRREKRYLRDIY